MSTDETPPPKPRGQVIRLFGDGPPAELEDSSAPAEIAELDSSDFDTASAARSTPPETLSAPAPDPLKDRRQRRALARIHALQGQLDGMVGKAFNLHTGMPASCVDLGRLQELLERVLDGFDPETILERWEVDLWRFLVATIEAHVQHVVELDLRPSAVGIDVDLRTRDDFGEYRYCFEVVLGR